MRHDLYITERKLIPNNCLKCKIQHKNKMYNMIVDDAMYKSEQEQESIFNFTITYPTCFCLLYLDIYSKQNYYLEWSRQSVFLA